jgi:hypothetical protein
MMHDLSTMSSMSGQMAPYFPLITRRVPPDGQAACNAKVLVRAHAAMDPRGWVNGPAEGDTDVLQV